MASLGVTVLPKDDSLQRAIMSVMEGWQRSRSDDRTRKQAADQFALSHGEDVRRTDSLVKTNDAAIEQATATQRSQLAKGIAEGFKLTTANLAKTGATPEAITKHVVDGMRAWEESSGDLPGMKELKGELRGLLASEFTTTPDTPGMQMNRSGLEFGAASAARAAAGGMAPEDKSLARRVAVGESSPAQEFAAGQQREAGPAQYGKAVRIAGDIEAGATSQLQASTQRATNAATNATQLQIAREGDANERTIAGMKATATGATDAEKKADAQEFKRRALVAAKALLSDPGLSGAVGTRINYEHGFGFRDAPAGGTPASSFVERAKQLESLASVEMLEKKLLPGAMSETDREMVLGLGSLAGKFKMEEKAYRAELQKTIDKMESDLGVTATYKFTATNPTTGQKIGSNDGENWNPIQ